MESFKTDTAYSWLVAFCAGVIFFVQYGSNRIAGIYYAESISYFQSDREAASYPYTLVSTMRAFAGPMVGFLYHILGMRKVIILGSFFSCLGIGFCFFATDILAVIILWGIIHGIGGAITAPLLLLALNLYFKKNVSNACGIALAGGSISGIVLPPLFQFIFEKYGYSGSYLIMSAVALHCIPAGMLIRNPFSISTDKIPSKSQDQLHDRRISDKIINGDSQQNCFYVIDNDANVLQKPQTNYLSHDRSFKYKVNNNPPSEVQSDITVNFEVNENRVEFKKLNECEGTKRHQNQATLVFEKQDEYFSQKLQCPQNNFEHQNKTQNQNCRIGVTENFQSMEKVDIHKSNFIVNLLSKYKHLFKPFKVYCNPSYILLALVRGFTFYRYTTLLSIIVDYSNDKGISVDDSKYFIMGAGFLDLSSRLVLGWITDGGYVSRKNYVSACSLFSAITLFMVVWFRGFTSLLVCVSLEGLWFGAIMTVMPSILCSYVEREQKAMALASVYSISFPLYVSSSSIIGYFRDDLGSYDILVYILMCLALMQGILLTFLPVVDRLWKKKMNSAQNDRNWKLCL